MASYDKINYEYYLGCEFVYCDSIVLCYGGDPRLHNILRASYSVMFSTEIHALNSMMDKRTAHDPQPYGRGSIFSFSIFVIRTSI